MCSRQGHAQSSQTHKCCNDKNLLVKASMNNIELELASKRGRQGGQISMRPARIASSSWSRSTCVRSLRGSRTTHSPGSGRCSSRWSWRRCHCRCCCYCCCHCCYCYYCCCSGSRRTRLWPRSTKTESGIQNWYIQGDHGGQRLVYVDFDLVVSLSVRICLGSCYWAEIEEQLGNIVDFKDIQRSAIRLPLAAGASSRNLGPTLGRSLGPT